MKKFLFELGVMFAFALYFLFVIFHEVVGIFSNRLYDRLRAVDNDIVLLISRFINWGDPINK